MYPIVDKNANATDETQPPMRAVSLIAPVVFVLTLLLTLWHNEFPASYHPDEPEKVAQVLDGHRDFHHPPLMLDAAAAVLHLVSDHHTITPDRVVQVGRCLSAFYMAAACAIFTWLAGFYGGTLAATFAALLLALDKQAVLAGHFFKEDPLFALGLALALLAGAYRWRNRSSLVSLIILGAATGLAAATKYLGIVTLIYALALELAISRMPGTIPNFARRVFVLLLTAFAFMFLFSVNSGWRRFPTMMQAIVEAGETAHRGNYGIGSRIPHWRFVGMFFLEPPLALVGFAFCWCAWARQKRSVVQYADRWLLLCAPLILLLVFSFSTITAVRYFLPISLLLSCVGGCGLAIGTRIVHDWTYRKWRCGLGLTTGLAIGICAAAQLPAIASLEKGFAYDDRRLLRDYIATKLPVSAVIAADELADLNAAPVLPQRVLARKTVADLGSLAELRARGITHVVVCWYDSRRYVSPRKHPVASAESDFLWRRKFYTSLKDHERVLWHSEIAQPFPLRPGLSLYQLSPAAQTSL